MYKFLGKKEVFITPVDAKHCLSTCINRPKGSLYSTNIRRELSASPQKQTNSIFHIRTKKRPRIASGPPQKRFVTYFFAGAAGAAAGVAGLGVMPIFFNTKSDILASAG
ncbi:MAG: hypothetical protein RLZZ474_520 [Bacteroidota bacterium]